MLSQAISSLTDKLKQFNFQSPSDPIIQLSVSIKALPVIAWLSAQPIYPRIYWKGRDTEEEVSAIGSCKDFFYDEAVDDNQLAMAYQEQRALTNTSTERLSQLRFLYAATDT